MNNRDGTQTKVDVGTIMLYRANYQGKPQTGNVSRITPKGWVRVTLASGKEVGNFKPSSWGNVYVGANSDVRGELCLYSDKQLADWEKQHEDFLAADLERKESQERTRKEREERDAKEMAETKSACGGDLEHLQLNKVDLPNGDRLYVLNLPVKPCYEYHKAGKASSWNGKDKRATVGFEVLIVRCSDVYDEVGDEKDPVTGEWRYKQVKKVEEAMTYCNGYSSNFTSCSTSQQQHDDESALWACVNRCYHSW